MQSKIDLKEQIQNALSNLEMTVEVRSLLLNIMNDLEKDLSNEQKFQLWLKWAGIVKDIAVVASKFIKGPEE